MQFTESKIFINRSLEFAKRDLANAGPAELWTPPVVVIKASVE